MDQKNLRPIKALNTTNWKQQVLLKFYTQKLCNIIGQNIPKRVAFHKQIRTLIAAYRKV